MGEFATDKYLQKYGTVLAVAIFYCLFNKNELNLT